MPKTKVKQDKTTVQKQEKQRTDGDKRPRWRHCTHAELLTRTTNDCVVCACFSRFRYFLKVCRLTRQFGGSCRARTWKRAFFSSSKDRIFMTRNNVDTIPHSGHVTNSQDTSSPRTHKASGSSRTYRFHIYKMDVSNIQMKMALSF